MSIAVFITSLLHAPLLPLTYTSDRWDSFPKVKNPLLGILFLTILPLESHDALFIVVFRTKKWKDEEENMEFLESFTHSPSSLQKLTRALFLSDTEDGLSKPMTWTHFFYSSWDSSTQLQNWQEPSKWLGSNFILEPLPSFWWSSPLFHEIDSRNPAEPRAPVQKTNFRLTDHWIDNSNPSHIHMSFSHTHCPLWCPEIYVLLVSEIASTLWRCAPNGNHIEYQ